jgi:ABC-2 type transport system ATP-binding protein
MIASGTPTELTRGGTATIRLVVTKPFPAGAPDSLQAALGPQVSVTPISDVSLLIAGPADSTTLATVAGWCEQQGVLPESLNLGQRNLEDVFLELTGRDLPRD